MNAVEEQERIAFHESAHVVVHHYFKHPVESVEIGQDTGRCVLPNEWNQGFDRERIIELAKRESLIEHIICCCAGRAAMDRWYGYKANTDENWKASDDYAQAFSYALALNDGDREGAELLVQWLLRHAEVIVEHQWSRIGHLSAALCDRGKIGGNEIRHILKGSGVASE